MKKTILIVILFSLDGIHAKIDTLKFVQKEIKIPQIDSLRYKFDQKKKLICQFETQSLIALSYFPELRNINIEFKRDNIKTTMAARPTIWSTLFTNPANRNYIILIDDQVDDQHGLLLDSIPFEAQVGIIAHELAHILDYSDKDPLRLMFKGLKYCFSKQYRKKMERNTDKKTIEHGLGWPLYSFASFVQNSKQISQEYKSFKKYYYMSPEEISDCLKDDDLNKRSLQSADMNK